MEIKEGDVVRYYFPNPANSEQKFFVGIVTTIQDDYVFILNERNIRLKVSFKNYHLIEPVGNHKLSLN